MAWNPSPEVAVARAAAKDLAAKQCIVIYLTESQIGMASYGQTKKLCAEAGKLGDVAYDAIMRELKARQP